MSTTIPHSVASNVEVRGLSIRFGLNEVLKSLDFDLRAGEIHAVTGENGAGKSSLAKAIAGVYRPVAGTIALDGSDVKLSGPREALRRGIALIHQDPCSFPDLDVADAVFAGNYPHRWGIADKRQAFEQSKSLLASLGSTIEPSLRMSALSVAQRQFVELASALAHQAGVWIFDETTAPLTPHEVLDLFAVMRSLKARGCAVMFVSHHLHEVFEIADRITVLRDGAKVAELDPKSCSPIDVVERMVGRKVHAERDAHRSIGDTIVAIEGLSGHGFNDVSLEVRSGEIVSIAGLVGAGRTELLEGIFGITEPSSGSVRVEGALLTSGSVRSARRLGIALVPEDRATDALFAPHSIGANVNAADWSRFARCGLVSDRKADSFATEWLLRLEAKYQDVGQSVRELSGGNQQKVVLARWLSSNPRVLLLDEPTKGVDVGAKAEFHRMIRDLAHSGMAIILASSDLNEVLALSHRILVMREGRVAGCLDGSDASDVAVLRLATGEGIG